MGYHSSFTLMGFHNNDSNVLFAWVFCLFSTSLFSHSCVTLIQIRAISYFRFHFGNTIPSVDFLCFPIFSNFGFIPLRTRAKSWLFLFFKKVSYFYTLFHFILIITLRFVCFLSVTISFLLSYFLYPLLIRSFSFLLFHHPLVSNSSLFSPLLIFFFLF